MDDGRLGLVLLDGVHAELDAEVEEEDEEDDDAVVGGGAGRRRRGPKAEIEILAYEAPELPDGARLACLQDLKRLVAGDPTFVRTVAHKLFVYAVGRDLRPIDLLRVDHAVAELVADLP